MIEPMPEPQPQATPALSISETNLVFTAPDGTTAEITISEMLTQGSNSDLLRWATFLIQKDMMERMGLMAHAVSELAQVLNALVQRAQQHPVVSQDEMIKKVLEQARDVVATMLPKKT